MTELELQKIALELRRKLFDILQEFWTINRDLEMNQIFLINSIVSSSLIAQTTYFLFKKDYEMKHKFAYIDEICKFAKMQLKDGSDLIKIKIQ